MDRREQEKRRNESEKGDVKFGKATGEEQGEERENQNDAESTDSRHEDTASLKQKQLRTDSESNMKGTAASAMAIANTDVQEKHVRRSLESVGGKELEDTFIEHDASSDVMAKRSRSMVPGAVAVDGSQLSYRHDDQYDDDNHNVSEAEVTTSSAAVYMVQATPVEEIVATEVVAEEKSEPIEVQNREVGTIFNEEEGEAINETKEGLQSPPTNLNIETVNFDEREGDEDAGLDIGTHSDGEAPKRFESKKHHYVLAIIIVLVYLLITVFTIFGLAVGEQDDGTDDDQDICQATKASVLSDWQNLKGFALCAYVFASTLAFIKVFEWRRYEYDEPGSSMVLPYLCSRTSMLKQVENRLIAAVYLMLHFFWLLFVAATRMLYSSENLGQFWDEISTECSDLTKPELPSLTAFNVLATAQLPLLLFALGIDIGHVFFWKKTPDDAARPRVERRRIRTILQAWVCDLVLFVLITLSLFLFILPIIGELRDL